MNFTESGKTGVLEELQQGELAVGSSSNVSLSKKAAHSDEVPLLHFGSDMLHAFKCAVPVAQADAKRRSFSGVAGITARCIRVFDLGRFGDRQVNNMYSGFRVDGHHF